MKSIGFRPGTAKVGVKREIRKDRIDGGGLTVAERVKVEAKQDNLSQTIYKEKHDARKKRWPHP